MRIFLATAACFATAIAVGATYVHRAPATEDRVQEGFALGEPAGEPKMSEPVFDLLSMGENGELLVAGRAEPNSTVDIVSEDGRLATVVTGARGDFVYTHSGPPRRYRLRLRTGDRLSRQVALAELADGDTTITITTAAVPDPSPPPGVTIEAVETDGGDLVVAGAVDRPGVVRVFVGDELVGETRTTANDRFLLQRMHQLASGRHTVRAVLVEQSGEAPVAQAMVPVVHAPDGPAPLQDDPAALRTGTSIIIRRGDSLWRISRRAYGKGTRYTRIFEANREQIADPDRIFAGQVFRLPDDADG